MTFLTLALIALVALVGPLLALPRKWHLPVVLGELLAGIMIGQTGLGLVDASDPIFTFLADIGFALIMFVVGSHVPVLDPKIRSALGTGALRAGVTAVLAVGVGTFIAVVFATGHAPLYVVLLASSSAALVLPIIDSLRLGGPQVLAMTTQVAVADIACIVALPLAVDPPHAGRAALGALAVGLCAVILFFALRWLERGGSRRRLHNVSERRKFALELRIQLAILFALAGLAVYSHVSIMLAGFSFGLVVAAIGEPRRLAHQLFALTDGFFGPLFFVWLGASLSFGDLVTRPPMLLLGLSLGLGALLVHVVLRVIGLPASLGVLSAAQLGVPVAAATIGTQLDLLLPGEAAALILGALITIAASAVAGSRAAERFTRPAKSRSKRPSPA
ncbi:cation:proton antiporter [Cryobacterium psychrophilum]|uniref:Cation:proton antiporter n=1 Tax=Cryobacterium psychrophilum TaxID=41988 RepID=A0A4Y8KU50_9MICO|nr:cation:proton antiporter [Cryobacterium psychrophilum]TDW28711.1 transporter (CPA2 family) [Cryobacterium psychrophilum]TFD82373.1 cation:proton antiporter [Cryobacterium psychrophilum]